MRGLLFLLATAATAATIQPGETLYVTAPVTLSEERVRLSVYSLSPGEIDITYSSPLDVSSGSGWRTTRIDGEQVRTWVYYTAAVTEYLSGPVGEFGIVNVGSDAFVVDRMTMNFRELSTGRNWGTLATVVRLESDAPAVPAPEPATSALMAFGLAFVLSRCRASTRRTMCRT